MTSSRRREQRPAAAFVAAIVLLCQAAAWVHAAAIPHVTCLEHGESVHLATPGQATSGEGLTVAATPAEDATHAHDHCSLQGHRTTRTPTPTLADVATTFVVATAPVAPPTRPAVCLLRLAPKTSPPRAPVV